MAVYNIEEKLKQIVPNEPSKWIEDAEWRSENEVWLMKSQTIAFKILERIDELNFTQKILADIMKVSPQHISKIVKGKENLTLETISKLEKALDIKLISIENSNTSQIIIQQSLNISIQQSIINIYKQKSDSQLNASKNEIFIGPIKLIA